MCHTLLLHGLQLRHNGFLPVREHACNGVLQALLASRSDALLETLLLNPLTKAILQIDWPIGFFLHICSPKSLHDLFCSTCAASWLPSLNILSLVIVPRWSSSLNFPCLILFAGFLLCFSLVCFRFHSDFALFFPFKKNINFVLFNPSLLKFGYYIYTYLYICTHNTTVKSIQFILSANHFQRSVSGRSLGSKSLYLSWCPLKGIPNRLTGESNSCTANFPPKKT